MKFSLTKKTIRHERGHALQILAGRSWPLFKQNKKKDAEAKLSKKIPFKHSKDLKGNKKFVKNWIEPTNIDFEWSPFERGLYEMVVIMRKTLRYKRTWDLFRKHGEDGMLLLWVAPPKSYDALHVNKWEKEMVQRGYLKPEGGLTKAGLRYWREHLHHSQIWQFLKWAGEQRAKNHE